MFHIIYVDDGPVIPELCKKALERSGAIEVDIVSSVDEAREAMQKRPYDAVVSEHAPPGIDGIAFLRSLREAGDEIPFIIFTGRGRKETVIAALNSDADHYIQKNKGTKADFADLEQKIVAVIERRQAEENAKVSCLELETALDAGQLGDWSFNNVTGRFTVSDRFWRILGTDTASEGGNSIEMEPFLKRFVHPEDSGILESEIERTSPVDSGVGQGNLQLRIVRKDGAVRTVFSHYVIVRDVKGEAKEIHGVLQDITERKMMEDALRESERKYRALVESAGEGIVVVQDEKFSMANPRAFEIIDLPSEQVLGHPFSEFIHPDDLPTVAARHRARSRGEAVPNKYEFRIVRKDGTVLWVAINAMRIEWDGKPATLNMLIDITEQKKARKEIEENLKFFKSLLDTVPIPLYFKDASRRYREFNKAFESFAGLPRDQMLGKTIREIVPGELADIYSAEDEKAFVDKKFQIYSSRIKYSDGKMHDVVFHKAPYIGDNGEMRGIIGAMVDVTDLRKMEIEVRNNEALLRLILNSAAEGIYGLDMNGNCIFCNDSCLKILRYERPEDLLGKNMHIKIHHKRADGRQFPLEECRIFQAFIHGNKEHVDDEVFWRADGTSFPAEYWSYPQVRDGNVVGAVVSFLDITERKLMEHMLNERIKELRSFYWLSEIAERKDVTLDDILKGLVVTLPKSWQYPEITCAKVTLWGRGYQSENYRESKWAMSSSIKVFDQSTGQIEVGYLEEMPASEDGPFMKEERRLLDAMAERIGRIAERMKVEEALKMTNHKLNILGSLTRHDIGNQLTGIMGYLDLCMLKEDDPALKKYMDYMSAASKSIQKQIAFTKQYQYIGVKEPTWMLLGNEAAESFRMLGLNGVTLVDEMHDVEVLIDPLAEKVPYNLIDNSMRHGEHVTKIRISTEKVGDSMMIVYEDNGVGISESDKKHIFESGFGKNTGFGLFLVKEILAITGISIQETGRPGEGVRFEMLVPPGAWRYKKK